MKPSIIFVLIALAATHELVKPTDEEPPPPEEDLDEESYDEENDTTAALTETGLFEGDIQLTEEQHQTLVNSSSSLHPSDERNAINNRKKLWRNGVIPYVLASGYTQRERQKIRGWLRDFGKTNCVRAVPRTNQRDYIFVHSGGGCSSHVGRKGGRQTLSLKRRGCLYRSTVLHEFMHAAGFWHEQSRADRDRYIRVVLQNVAPKMRYNFKTIKRPIARLIGTYDYKSVMQYGSYAFSYNRRKTLVLKKNPAARLGQRPDGTLTSMDIFKLRRLYRCRGCANDRGDSTCNYWKKQGYCTRKYVAFMRKSCAKACRRC